MVGFSREGAKRIAAATKYVERSKRNPPPRYAAPPVPAPTGRWAKIGEGSEGKYSWTALEANDDHELEENEDWGSGDHTAEQGYAVEARWKSADVPKGSIVWLVPAAGEGVDHFLFDYSPGVRIAKLIEGDSISKRTGTTCGEGEVTLLQFDPETKELTDQIDGTDSITITAYNPFAKAIPEDPEEQEGDLHLEIEFGEGAWFVTGVECPDDEDGTGA